MLMLLGLLAPSASGQAAEPTSPSIGGFSARALGPGDELTPETYFKVTLPPGGTFSGRLLVLSSVKEPSRLRFYSVDGLTGPTSGTVYANIDDPREDASRWITPRKDLLRLPGKGEKKVGFDVKVPEDATPGDHVGGVALQLAEQKKTEGQFAITQITRVAVAVQITVEGPAETAVRPTNLKLAALPGTQIPAVTVGLENTGQLLCRPKLAVVLSQDGAALGTVTRQLDTILPGDAIPYPLGWPKPLPAGKYTAKAETSGCGPVQEVSGDVELKAALTGSQQTPGTILTPGDDGGPQWWVIVLATLGGVLAVLAIVGLLLLLRRRRRAGDEPTPQA